MKVLVKISDLDEYLHADAVETGEVIEITRKARYISSEESTFGRAYLEIPVRLANGKSKIWTPNKTTLKRMAKVFGDDADTWIGQKVRLEIVKQNVRGEMRDVIYGKPVTEPDQKQLQPNLQ